jgi:SAM-dependent methyltransferase
MRAVDVAHGGLVHPRRVRVLADRAVELIPPCARVLDVGSGDGLLAAAIAARRPDVHIEGIDVLVRDDASIPVAAFDGRVIPKTTGSVDVVTFFDVLHHADEPTALLREGARVARSCIVLKDHVCNTAVARFILRFMDDVGNARHNVALPHNYWSSTQWSAAIHSLRLERATWQVGGLGLYPWPASLVFGDGLHVLARLDVSRQAA